MANPNIVNVSSILGKTSVTAGINNSAQTLLTTSSNEIIKINTVMACNTTLSNKDVSLKYGSVHIAKDITIPPGSSIALIGKDTPIYLEESQTLSAYASATSSVDITVSYEIISST